MNGPGAGYGDGTYTLTNGTLNTGAIVVGGSGGTGTVAQTGGTVTITDDPGNMNPFAGTLTVAATVPGSTGTYDLDGGTLNAPSVVINTGGAFNLSGGTLVTDNISNSGVLNYTSGTLVVSDLLTNTTNGLFNITDTVGGIFGFDVINDGTIKLTASSITWTGNFTNNGVYNSDPSTSYFTNLLIGNEGYLIGGVGDVFSVSGDFINSSTQNSLWDTNGATLEITGAGNHIVDFGSSANGGYANNFAWGALTVEAGASLEFTSMNAVIYAGIFDLQGGLEQLANISGDFTIYYDTNLAENAYLGGDDYELQGGGHLIASDSGPPGPPGVPEPGSVFLIGSGLAGLAAYRNRKRRKHPESLKRAA
jgi:hypothetical protein